MMNELIVTLDGPAGSGKSSVARMLAKRLGVDFLDTGAMYRGLTAVCVDNGIDPAADPDAAGKMAQRTELHFDWKTDPPRLYAGEQDLTPRLRDADVTGRVSQLAAIAAVRHVLVESQRRIGKDHPRLVTEGRDQGSVVFPNAQVKFYLDASAEVRARRRADQLREAGREADEQQILKEIQTRDHRDSHRTEAPLICPEDAIHLDTSDMTLDQVVQWLEEQVAKRREGNGCSTATAGE